MSGFYDEALNHLRICVEQRPANAKLRTGLAGIYCKLGQADLALESLNQAIRLEPMDSREHHSLLAVQECALPVRGLQGPVGFIAATAGRPPTVMAIGLACLTPYSS